MIQVKMITAAGDDYELLDAGAAALLRGSENSDGKGAWSFGSALVMGNTLKILVYREAPDTPPPVQ